MPTYTICINEIQRRMLLQSCLNHVRQLMTTATDSVQEHEAEELLTLIRGLDNPCSPLSTTAVNSFVL